MMDFSPAARHAHRFVRRQFPEAQLDLLHVVPVGALAEAPPRPPAYLGRRTVTQAALEHERVRKAAAHLGILGGGLLAEGNPAEVALTYAESGTYDLLALGTAARGRLGRLMFGSVAGRVVRDSPVPVLTARGNGLRLRRVRRVLVPTDFSPHAARALELVRTAWPSADVRLLHAVDIASPEMLAPGPSAAAGLGPLGESERAWREEAQGRLRELGDGEVVTGPPTPCILTVLEAGSFDLVALGTAGRRGVEGLLFGSVARGVVRESPVPVLTVRVPGGGSG